MVLNHTHETIDDKGLFAMHPDAVLQMVRSRVEANAVLQSRRQTK